MILKVKARNTMNKHVLRGFVAFAALLLAFIGVAGALRIAQAASSPVAYTNVPFVLSEWTTDRAVPSGGAELVSFEGRNNVLQMDVDGANRSTSTDSFNYTEGLKHELTAGAEAIKADLYVDSTWQDTDVRAGLWGVGNNTGGAISAYPIVEFTSSDSYTGWRSWDGFQGGWSNLPDVKYKSGNWNTVAIVLNDETGLFDVYINNTLADTSTGNSSVELDEVILNQYNYGVESTDYSVRWSNFAEGLVSELANPTSKEACKGNGWSTFGFRNQGLCVQYTNTGKDSR